MTPKLDRLGIRKYLPIDVDIIWVVCSGVTADDIITGREDEICMVIVGFGTFEVLLSIFEYCEHISRNVTFIIDHIHLLSPVYATTYTIHSL